MIIRASRRSLNSAKTCLSAMSKRAKHIMHLLTFEVPLDPLPKRGATLPKKRHTGIHRGNAIRYQFGFNPVIISNIRGPSLVLHLAFWQHVFEGDQGALEVSKSCSRQEGLPGSGKNLPGTSNCPTCTNIHSLQL